MLDQILMPVLIVTGIGLLAGLILSILSHFIEVPDDEKAKAILEVLPGANCAGCGYVGCEEYARAVSKGLAKANLCTPGGSRTATQIAQIIGEENEGVVEKVAYVKCQGSKNDDKIKLIYKGVQTCHGASMYFGGQDYCIYGCIGMGDCIACCPFEAISLKEGIAFVNKDLCTGCGLCVSECPKKLITLTNKDNKAKLFCNSKDKGGVTKKICAEGCIRCGICAKNCEFDAIKIVNNMAVIDEEKCTSCGKCIEVCPQKVIVF